MHVGTVEMATQEAIVISAIKLLCSCKTFQQFHQQTFMLRVQIFLLASVQMALSLMIRSFAILAIKDALFAIIY